MSHSDFIRLQAVPLNQHVEGGVTFTRGGWPFVILSAGYLGSLLAGSVLLYLSNRLVGAVVDRRAMGACVVPHIGAD